MLLTIITSVISAATLALLGFIFRACKKALADIRDDFAIMKKSQRNQLKSEITRIYHDSKARGFIYENDLSNVLTMFDDYVSLGGNSFMPILVERMKLMDIESDEIKE